MSLRHALLGLLAEEPASGYDLLGMFQRSLAHVWPATQSQLYTELTKLAAADLITVVAEGARGRKEYAITEAGHAELVRWLLNPERGTPHRSPELLRVFFLHQAGAPAARRYLELWGERFDGYHAELTALLESTDWDNTTRYGGFGRLTLEWGLRYAEMNREWAKWAVGHVPPDGPDRPDAD